MARHALVCDHIPINVCYTEYLRGRLGRTMPHLYYNLATDRLDNYSLFHRTS